MDPKRPRSRDKPRLCSRDNQFPGEAEKFGSGRRWYRSLSRGTIERECDEKNCNHGKPRAIQPLEHGKISKIVGGIAKDGEP